MLKQDRTIIHVEVKASTPNSLLCIFRQCISRVPSLNALNDSFSMNDIPSTNMLLTFAPNSTLFTSLPLTIGLKCGLLRLTILLGMLSLPSLFRKWFFCWRYILVMISISLFSLTVNKFSAFSWSLTISRISFSILPSRSSSLRVIFLVWPCCACAVSCMSGSPSARQGTLFGDDGFPVCCSTRTSSHSSSQIGRAHV